MTTKRNSSTKDETSVIQHHLETEYFPTLAYYPTRNEIANYCATILHKSISEYLAGRFITEYFGPYTGDRTLGKKQIPQEKKDEVVTINVATVITDDDFAAILKTAVDFYNQDVDHLSKDLRMAILKNHGAYNDKRLNRIITEVNRMRKEQIDDRRADINIWLYDNYFALGRKLPTATKLILAVKNICPMMNITTMREICKEYRILHKTK